MSNFRMGANVTEHYTSFTDLAKAFGCKSQNPNKSKKKAEIDKLEKQQTQFLSKHVCKACHVPMVYTGGNVLTCNNPKCKGIPETRVDKEGKEYTVYHTSYDLLSAKGASIASRLFS